MGVRTSPKKLHLWIGEFHCVTTSFDRVWEIYLPRFDIWTQEYAKPPLETVQTNVQPPLQEVPQELSVETQAS